LRSRVTRLLESGNALRYRTSRKGSAADSPPISNLRLPRNSGWSCVALLFLQTGLGKEAIVGICKSFLMQECSRHCFFLDQTKLLEIGIRLIRKHQMVAPMHRWLKV